MKGFLEYVDSTSVLHRMNPVAKLVCSFLTCIACFCTSNLPFLLAVLVGGFFLAVSCGMARQVVGLAKAVFMFSLILAIVQIFTTPGGASLVMLPWGHIGTAGLVAAFTTVARLLAAAVPLFLTLYVTRMTDLANALVKNVRLPYKYAFTFTSTIRFIPAFLNDMAAIIEAQTARGVQFDQGGIVSRVRLTVPLCVPLLVSSVRKVNSAAIAAEVRGFNLRNAKSGYREYPMALCDGMAVAACVFLLAAALAVNVLF